MNARFRLGLIEEKLGFSVLPRNGVILLHLCRAECIAIGRDAVSKDQVIAYVQNKERCNPVQQPANKKALQKLYFSAN